MTELMPNVPVMTLVLIRVTAFFVTVPLFSYRTIPPNIRVILAVLIAWMMSFSLQGNAMEADGLFIMKALQEAAVGLLLGLAAYVVLSAIQLAGSFIDFQMGFAIASVIDPQTGAQSPLVGQFFNVLALLLLLAMDGHHMLLEGLFTSYEYMPLGGGFPAFSEGAFPEFAAGLITTLFAIAFQIASPIVAALFLTDLALGITARTVPQLNIFVIGFPVKIAVTFLLLLVTFGIIIGVMQTVFSQMAESLRELLFIMNGE